MLFWGVVCVWRLRRGWPGIFRLVGLCSINSAANKKKNGYYSGGPTFYSSGVKVCSTMSWGQGKACRGLPTANEAIRLKEQTPLVLTLPPPPAYDTEMAVEPLRES